MPAHDATEPTAVPGSGDERWFRWHAGAAAFSLGLVNTFIPVLAIRLGASNPELGALSAFPNLLAIPALLFGSQLFSTGSKGRWVRRATIAARLGFLAAATVPTLPVALRVQALVLFWAMTAAADGVATMGINNLVADRFGAAARNRVLASRGRYATLAGLAAGLIGGVLLDHLPFPAGYRWVFTAAALLGTVEVALVSRLSEPEAGHLHPPAVSRGGWLQLWQHREVMRFFLASAVLHLNWQTLWPIFNRYQITELGANNTWMSIMAVTSSIGSVATYTAWVRWGERWGQRRMLAAAAALLALTPLLNALLPSLPALAAVNVIAGASVSGVSLLVMALLLEVAPTTDRPRVLAAHQAMVAATGTVAPFLGAWLMEWISVRQALLLGFGFRMLLGAGGILLLDWLESRRCPPRPAVHRGA